MARVESQTLELVKTAAEVSTLAAALADLTAKVRSAREELDELGSRSSAPTGERIDELDGRVGELAAAVSSMRSQVQALIAPESRVSMVGTYRDGFVVGTTDGRFVLRTKGYAQFRYTAEANRDPELETSGFTLRRARLAWDGNVYVPELIYKVQLDFGQGATALQDYFIEGNLPLGLRLKGGQFKVPFSRAFLNSAEALTFVESAIATEEFRYDRDLGIWLSWRGLADKLELGIGVFNGAGKNVKANDNIDPLLVGRVSTALLGKPWKPEEGDPEGTDRPALVFGLSMTVENTPVPSAYGYQGGSPVAPFPLANADVDADGEIDNVRVVEGEVDLAFRYRGFGVEAEGYVRNESWGSIGSAQTAPFSPEPTFLGGVLQGSYFILPGRFQVGVRASMSEVSPLSIGGKTRTETDCIGPTGTTFSCSLPTSDLRLELSLLVAYYRFRHGVELGAMYSFLDWLNEEAANDQSHRLIVETQVGF